jgi:predicted AAA+ superfamily ATPase
MEDELKRLFEFNELAKKDGMRFEKRRRLFDEIAGAQGRIFIGIVGPRGVGKTVLLRQLSIAREDSFYLSLDTFAGDDLFGLVRKLVENYGIRLLLLDEIHFLKGYQAVLKNIFDFLDLRVVFTSSVALSLYESAHDLSRRVALKHLFPFSFGEYLRFRESAELPALSLADIAEHRWSAAHERWGYLFDDYLQGGLFPFALEVPDAASAFENIKEKVITRDIAVTANLQNDEVDALRKLIRFVGKSSTDGVNFSSISRNVGITKFKAQKFVSLLEKSFFLNPVMPAGTNVLREPKVLMWLPWRQAYRSFEEAVGEIREDFTAQAVRMRCGVLQYLKSMRGEKTPDFLVEEGGRRIVVEVGGKGKGRMKFKGMEAKEKLILSHGGDSSGMRRPLFLFGYF